LTTDLGRTLRHAGISVPEPRDANLAEQLAESIRRVSAGESLEELSRRDPEAMCALATTRALTLFEARMLLGSYQYLEGVIEAAAREREALRSWTRHQQDNAAAWGRECRHLGETVEAVANAAGVPHLAREHELLAAAVQYLVSERKAPPARPVDANTAAIVRASEELVELRALARGVAEALGQPGLEQDPARLGALLVEALSVMHEAVGVVVENARAGRDPQLQAITRLARDGVLDVAVASIVEPKAEPCNCGGKCTRRGDQEVCDTCGRSWRTAGVG
jgi:hypothetical protein